MATRNTILKLENSIPTGSDYRLDFWNMSVLFSTFSRDEKFKTSPRVSAHPSSWRSHRALAESSRTRGHPSKSPSNGTADEFVTIASTFWDFGSLSRKTLRRPLCQQLWQRQSFVSRRCGVHDDDQKFDPAEPWHPRQLLFAGVHSRRAHSNVRPETGYCALASFQVQVTATSGPMLQHMKSHVYH